MSHRMQGSTICLLALALILISSVNSFGQHYQQTNLVSDIPGLAKLTDSNLVNPWGLVATGSSPWWVGDNGTGVSTLYTGAGAKVPLTVTIPPPLGSSDLATPTGVVTGSGSDFGGSRFIFVTEDGTISGWTGGNAANLMFTSPVKAVYKGVTLGQMNGLNFLYVANFFNASVDVFDANFMPFTNLPPTAFKDSEVPAGFAPFNVQNLDGNIFVTFAKQKPDKEDEVDAPGLGFVDQFDSSGKLLSRLRSGHWMNAPWGIALAPEGFGKESGRLLVGQFGSGEIATFDLEHGNFHGLLRGLRGQPLTIDGLWALRFGNGAAAGPQTTLFFTAGIDDENHGLFGTITPVEKGKGHKED